MVKGAGGATVRVNDFALLPSFVSPTTAKNVTVPAWVGVPEITPADDSVNPGGKDPDSRNHVYGGAPPVAVSVCEYGEPTLAFGRGDPLVMVSGGNKLTDSSRDLLSVLPPASST